MLDRALLRVILPLIGEYKMYNCVSVCGGWQSVLLIDGHTFGPIFNSVVDLWKWQRANLMAPA